MMPDQTFAESSRKPWVCVAGVMLIFALVPPVVMAWLVSTGPTFGADDQVVLTVVNPGPHQVDVEVTGEDRAGWLNLGTVDPQETRVTGWIANQGSQWVFRFSTGGAKTGELVIPRYVLEDEGWILTVPAMVADHLPTAVVTASQSDDALSVLPSLGRDEASEWAARFVAGGVPRSLLEGTR